MSYRSALLALKFRSDRASVFYLLPVSHPCWGPSFHQMLGEGPRRAGPCRALWTQQPGAPPVVVTTEVPRHGHISPGGPGFPQMRPQAVALDCSSPRHPHEPCCPSPPALACTPKAVSWWPPAFLAATPSGVPGHLLEPPFPCPQNGACVTLTSSVGGESPLFPQTPLPRYSPALAPQPHPA